MAVCSRCLGLGWVPAQHPIFEPTEADALPCPDCRYEAAVEWLRRKKPKRQNSRATIDEQSGGT